MTAVIDEWPRDTFVCKKLDYIQRAIRDRRLLPVDRCIAVGLANYVNRETGQAWPTQETLAEMVGVTSRTVRASLDRLAEFGWITIAKQRGRGFTSRYLLSFDHEGEAGECHDRKRASGHGHDDRKPTSTQSDADIALIGNPASSRPEAGFLQNTVKNTVSSERKDYNTPSFALGEPSQAKPAGKSVDRQLDEEFANWWKQYPRKVDKGHAQLAYFRVRRTGKATADELLSGVLRYSASVTHKEARFIKHAQTWLNGQCWLDEPEPAFDPAAAVYGTVGGPSVKPTGLGAQIIGLRNAVERRRQAGLTGTASAVAGIMGAMGGGYDD